MITKRYELAKNQMIPTFEKKIKEEGKFEYLGNLKNEIFYVAIYHLMNQNDVKYFKQNIFLNARIDEIQISKFNLRIFDYSLPQTLYAPLTDNWSYLENTYSKLRYSTTYIDDKSGQTVPITMDENVLKGESAIWCNTIQFLMANDISGVERNLSIIEEITLPKLPKNQQELKLDFEFYKALLKKDKSECEAILHELLTPKIHKKRNDNPVLAQYVSQPALGYAKLAWRLGIEVAVNSPLIPKELLPIQPLDHYEVPYDFLK